MTRLSSPALATRSRAGRGAGPRLASRLVREDGAMLLEVLMAAVILGIAILGLAVMFSAGNTYIVAQGDNRVAMYLAEQKVEKLRARGFATLVGDKTAPSGCVPNTWMSPEPCNSETGPAGFGGTQTFTRTTCVNFVQDKNPAVPALTPGAPPTCPADCLQSGSGACSRQTMRITVTVMPTTMKANQGDFVTLETVVIAP